MKILVISGSPKMEKSITYHHMVYLEKEHPNHNFEYCHIQSKTIMKNYDEYYNKMILADLIIFAYPVHTLQVPYGLMLFMKKLIADRRKLALNGKAVFQFSTSKHFFDITANHYMK